jgi:hypothetical protein
MGKCGNVVIKLIEDIKWNKKKKREQVQSNTLGIRNLWLEERMGH